MYDTISYFTCAQKLTDASLIYCMESKIKREKIRKKNFKNRYAAKNQLALFNRPSFLESIFVAVSLFPK